jgi:hypothetical protein
MSCNLEAYIRIKVNDTLVKELGKFTYLGSEKKS